MQALATSIYPAASWRHAGDLAWAWTLANDAPMPTAVWRENGRVLAWAWFEAQDELTVQVDPAHPELADDVLTWAHGITAARESTPAGDFTTAADFTTTVDFTVTISANEQHLVPALTARGFSAQLDGPFFSCLSLPLTGDLPPVPELPAGYVIRSVRDEDIPSRAAIHRAAWNSTDITTERHAAMRRLWPYKPEFDLVAFSPKGEAAAYYQGWYDELNGIGLFEPVGTHLEHRRLGLSRAVGIALLHAFADAGGKLAAVCPRGDAAYPVPKLVYESMGFREYSRTFTYEQTRRPQVAQEP